MTPWGADVVEKVARGLAVSRRYDPDLQWTAHAKDARAAILATIEALGEPTDKMIDAGRRGPEFTLQDMWRRMLSQARTEIEENEKA